ncbi:hypothetical protein JXL21_05800 [Candidatus Bathyarchaeota archaeon]|nr:hypothetical protein [Candidatus Bathyarchaeota archaeon]
MSEVYPKKAVEAHRDGLIYIHCLGGPDKGYSAGWSLESLAETDNQGDLGESLTRIVESLTRLEAEWAGPQAVNSLDAYAAAHLHGGEMTDSRLKEIVVDFVGKVNESIRPSLAVSLDLKPDAAMVEPPYTTSETYASQGFIDEMDRFNHAFAEALEQSYRRGLFRVVPILNLMRHVDWGSETLSRYISTSYRYGYPIYQNFYTGTLHPRYLHGTESLEPDPLATYLRHGGVHGNSDGQGILDVVTLNLPRISHESRDEEDFFNQIDAAMELARDAHESKRGHLETMLEEGMLPETARHVDSLDWHFSAVNMVGMNEALTHVIGAGTEHVAGKAVTYRLLEHMIRKLETIQEETGHIYTLEAAPCEEAGAAMAQREAADNPGEAQPFYTGSTELPPWHGDDLWDALEHQKKYHGIYTGGDVFQIHLAEGVDYREECKLLLRRTLEVFGFNHLKVSPVFSLCGEHGYITGERSGCPMCGEETQVITWVDCSPRSVGSLGEGLKEAYRRRVYSDVKDR